MQQINTFFKEESGQAFIAVPMSIHYVVCVSMLRVIS